MTPAPRCPICDTPVSPPDRSSPPAKSFFPFCSDRCRMVDLGRWLTGQYSIPGESAIEDEPEAAEPPRAAPAQPADEEDDPS